MNVFETVTFAPGQTVANLTVRLSPDDVFTEADEIFELYLGPGEGVYINPIAAANVVILNDDPDLPGVGILLYTCTTRFCDIIS